MQINYVIDIIFKVCKCGLNYFISPQMSKDMFKDNVEYVYKKKALKEGC
jgi:hypothetical protein